MQQDRASSTRAKTSKIDLASESRQAQLPGLMDLKQIKNMLDLSPGGHTQDYGGPDQTRIKKGCCPTPTSVTALRVVDVGDQVSGWAGRLRGERHTVPGAGLPRCAYSCVFHSDSINNGNM